MRMIACFAIVLLLLAGVAGADLGAITWSGGSLRVMDGHPTVSLFAEQLILEPQDQTTFITALMSFRNTGEACEVEMGFPTISYGGPGYHFVRNFVVDVDGQILPTEKHEAPLTVGGREVPAKWELLSVPFAAGQERLMRVRYDEFRLYGGATPVRVPYVLATGGSWLGPIEDLQLEVRLGDRLNFHDLRLRGDEAELPWAWDDATLTWRVSDFDGQPEVLWFEAGLGPKSVTRSDGIRASGDKGKVRWRRGLMFVEVDFLCDVLHATKQSARGTMARLTKQGQKVRAEGWLLPVGEAPKVPPLYVDPRPALATFGGSIEVTTDENGDAVVAVLTTSTSGAAAQATALFAGQTLEYRLRCLEALHLKWPELLKPVCEELLERPGDKVAVKAWSVAYLAQGAQPAEARALYEQVSRRGGAWQELIEAALQTRSDEVLHGATLVLREGDREAARDLMIARISECDDWRQAKPRGRNCGLALKLMEAPGAEAALTDTTRALGVQQHSEDALIALGYLGDDAAIPFLTEIALAADTGRSRDMNCAAAEGLAYLGTRAGLAACADVSRRSADEEVRSRALRGMEMAMGTKYYRAHYLPEAAPEWARTLTSAEATETCVPLLEELAASEDQHLVARANGILRKVRTEVAVGTP